MAIEREVKLGAWAGFEVPPLDGIVDHVSAEARPPRTLTAVYYDTPDLGLARWGVSLRHRTGDGTPWTVKLPEGDDGPALVRRELTFHGASGAVPAAAAGLVLAYVRAAELAPVARLRTVRRAVDLLDADGARVAEVVDDEVSVLHGGRVAARFRELEVELGDRAPAGLLEAVVGALRRAGAGEPDRTSKVVRALGPRALAPPEVALTDLGREPTAAALVRNTIAASVVRILRHDAGVRIGDDPEDVHQLRVGTRRLRSDLRTFAPLLEDAWLTPLRDELRWLAGALGAVRDADVLLDRLQTQAATLPDPDMAGLAPIFRQLANERESARDALLEAMSGTRYLALLDSLVAASASPAFRGRADRAAAGAVPRLVARPWTRLHTAVRALPADSGPEQLHAIRILAKRARYAADAAVPVAGKRAAAFASGLARLQSVLGDHHDAVIAEAWLRRAVAQAGPGAALAAGELIALQRDDATTTRRKWRSAWRKASDKKLRSWL